jgi:RimJ/RimL family protein N-acetyltransferase
MSYFLETEKTGLRPVTIADVTDEYLRWMNDAEVTRGLESGIFPSTKESIISFVEKTANSKENIFLAICDKSTGKHIGNIKLGNVNWVHRHADLGILIGDKSAWGKGFGTDACKLLVDHAFTKLNLHKVWLAVFSNNPSAIKVYKRLNFIEEGRLKEHVFSDGKFVDKIIMSAFNPKE